VNANPAAVTTGESVVRGGMWNLAGRLVPQIYLAILSIAAARFLGPDDFGRQSFIAFVEISLVMLLAAGLPAALTRFVAHSVGKRDPAAARGLMSWSWRIEVVAAALGAVGMVAVAFAGAEPQAAWILAAVAMAASTLGRVPTSFLNGLQRWRDPTLVGLATATVATPATIVVLALGGGITGMFAVEALTATMALAVLVGLGWQRARGLAPAARRDAAVQREMIRYAGLLTVSIALTFIIWRRSELFFLERYSTDAEIGFYTIAFTAATVPVLLFQGFTATLLPAVANLLGAGENARIRSGFSRAGRLLLAVSLPATAIGLALGPELVRVAYGDDFADAVAPLVILLSLTWFVPLVNLSGDLLAGVARLRPMVVAGAVASVVDVGIAFLLVPHYDAVGAAIASICAQATVGVPVILYARRTVENVRWRPPMVGRQALASAFTGVAAWACVELIGGVAGLVAGGVVAIVAFALVARALRILSEDDALWLEGVAGGRMGGMIAKVIRLWAQPSREAGPT
jgi:O-antigen/teichoic acid export membrane protein